MVKYKVNGRKMTGVQLISYASKQFTKDSHGLSRYARPNTVKKAIYFLERYSKKNVDV